MQNLTPTVCDAKGSHCEPTYFDASMRVGNCGYNADSVETSQTFPDFELGGLATGSVGWAALTNAWQAPC